MTPAASWTNDDSAPTAPLSIVSARRSCKICSTACASFATPGWLWSSVKRFRQSKRPGIFSRVPPSPALPPYRRLLAGREIPRPVGAADAELGLPVVDPSRMIEHLPPAQAHHVPPRRRMIPIAVGHLGKGVSRLEVSDIVGREGDLGGAHLSQEIADTMHVLPPIEIGLGHEILRPPARDFVGVREIVGMRQRARDHLPAE